MANLQSVMSRIQLLLFGFISSILIVLFSIVGCSDPSHTGSIVSSTGSMLTHADVDDYLTSIRGGRYCIHNDTDSACIDLVPLVNGAVDTNGPIIHIYPEKTVYLFHYEGKPIVRAERVGDTTDFVEKLPDADQDPPKRGPSTPGSNNNGDDDNDVNNDNSDDETPANPDDNNDENPDNTDPTDNTNDGHGWLIWIYYPEGTAPINPPTLSESNVTVTINGKQLTDEDITGFAQFIGIEGERGIQFFYPTESAELLDLKVQMVGITDRQGNVRFNINYLWNSY